MHSTDKLVIWMNERARSSPPLNMHTHSQAKAILNQHLSVIWQAQAQGHPESKGLEPLK